MSDPDEYLRNRQKLLKILDEQQPPHNPLSGLITGAITGAILGMVPVLMILLLMVGSGASLPFAWWGPSACCAVVFAVYGLAE